MIINEDKKVMTIIVTRQKFDNNEIKFMIDIEAHEDFRLDNAELISMELYEYAEKCQNSLEN